MADTKLESFKIADTRKPSVAGAAKKTPEAPDNAAVSEAHSLGFKRIESILEKEDPSAVRASLERLESQLSALEKEGASNKAKASAKKAIQAVKRTTDLMDYLFQTKATMQASTGK